MSWGLSTRFCKTCGVELTLNNRRDIERKKYCSHSCQAKFVFVERRKYLPLIRCIGCNLMFQPKSDNQRACSEKCYGKTQVENSYRHMNGNWDAYISHLLARSNRKHLKLQEIKDLFDRQKGLCALSKVPLTCIKIPKSKKIHSNLSIDRIDSKKGYELENIQLVCSIVNIMKSNLTLEEFKWWIKQIHEGV